MGGLLACRPSSFGLRAASSKESTISLRQAVRKYLKTCFQPVTEHITVHAGCAAYLQLYAAWPPPCSTVNPPTKNPQTENRRLEISRKLPMDLGNSTPQSYDSAGVRPSEIRMLGSWIDRLAPPETPSPAALRARCDAESTEKVLTYQCL